MIYNREKAISQNFNRLLEGFLCLIYDKENITKLPPKT